MPGWTINEVPRCTLLFCLSSFFCESFDKWFEMFIASTKDVTKHQYMMQV